MSSDQRISLRAPIALSQRGVKFITKSWIRRSKDVQKMVSGEDSSSLNYVRASEAKRNPAATAHLHLSLLTILPDLK